MRLPTGRHRDALLALAATAALLAGATALGLPLERLASPRGLAAGLAGAVGALGLELAMAARPETARRLWADRRVRWGGTALVAVGGPAAVALAGTTVGLLATACLLGGFAAYAVVLVGVLTGAIPGPETWGR